jgi:hypothetical protein
MFEKAGKFYADWRDRKGARKRKSFKSSRAALTFEAEQKELAHPKSPARGRMSRNYFSSNSQGATKAQCAARPADSSPRAANSNPAKSAPPTSKRQTKPSEKAHGLRVIKR